MPATSESTVNGEQDELVVIFFQTLVAELAMRLTGT
jgi:hypothetical protein